MDIIDGREVPPRRIDGEETIAGTHRGSLIVARGGHLRLAGTQRGTVHVEPCGAAEVLGSLQGTLHVERSAHVQIHGRQQGTVHVKQGGLVEVAATGRLQGTLHVDGRLINGGVRGGTVHGNGSIEDVEGGTVKGADEIWPDGTHVYRW